LSCDNAAMNTSAQGDGLETPAAGEAPAGPIRTVLVVEADGNLRDLIKLWLSRAGYAVLLSGDAEAAQEAVLSGEPDLVILDLLLTGSNGFTLLDWMRRAPVSHEMPVLVVTTHDNAEDRCRSFELGAAGFLRKPFHGRDLVAKVARIMREERIP
jgi:DNA-binding response OmpR family regulator